MKKYAVSKLTYEYERNRPLQTLFNKIQEYQDTHFSNRFTKDGRPKTHNGFNMYLSTIDVNGINHPTINISTFGAGNTIIQTWLFGRDSLLSDTGNTTINLSNVGRHHKHIGNILDLISDYYYEDDAVRYKEFVEHYMKPYYHGYVEGHTDEYEGKHSVIHKNGELYIRLSKLKDMGAPKITSVIHYLQYTDEDGRNRAKEIKHEFELIDCGDHYLVHVDRPEDNHRHEVTFKYKKKEVN